MQLLVPVLPLQPYHMKERLNIYVFEEDLSCVVITANFQQIIKQGSFWSFMNIALCDMCARRRRRSAWTFAQSGQSLLCVLRVDKDPNLRADSEVSVQTERLPKLIAKTLISLCSCAG